MSFYSICFSPTGGTEKVLELLAEGLGEQPEPVDLSDMGTDFSGIHLKSEDVCFIGVPSFGGRVPETALRRLADIKGNDAAAILVVSFGNRAYDDTLLELQDAALECGFSVMAAVAGVTEHSIMRQYGAGRPDDADQAELKEFGKRIRNALEKKNRMVTEGEPDRTPRIDTGLKLPGNRPFREYHGVPFTPKAGKSCTGCGICASLCPIGAIPAGNPGETDSSSCISCMRCITVCPAGARSLNKAMLFAASQKMKKEFAQRKGNELFL